jgi:O-methyltransferase
MKTIVKKIVYGLFNLISWVKTSFFSRSLLSFGYLIKSEAFYNNCNAELFKGDRFDLHVFLPSKYLSPQEEIHFFEFGVLWGQITRRWCDNNKNPNSRFWGFDTFTGLPEDWGSVKKGSFSAKGKLPDINDSRLEFCVGLIQDTLPPFLTKYASGVRKVIHIDVDLYNASLFTLIQFANILKAGDIIIFDDFFTLTKADHEYKSFIDFLSLYPVKYKSLYKCRNGHFVIEIA